MKAIYLIAISFLFFSAFVGISSAFNLNTGTQVIYPQNEMNMYNSSTTNSEYCSEAILMNELGGWILEWNMSTLPCNASVTNFTFNCSSDYQSPTPPSTETAGSFQYYYNFHAFMHYFGDYTISLDDLTYTQAKNCVQSSPNETAGMGGDNNIAFMNESMFIPFGTYGLIWNATTSMGRYNGDDWGLLKDESWSTFGYSRDHFDGRWYENYVSEESTLDYSRQYNHAPANFCENASVNYPWYRWFMEFHEEGGGDIVQHFNTNLAPLLIQRPCIKVNYSFNVSNMTGMTLTNGSVVKNGDTFSMDLHNDYGNRIKWRIRLYNVSSGGYTNMTKMYITDWDAGDSDYNQTVSFTLSGLDTASFYWLWVDLAGNSSSTLYYVQTAGASLSPTATLPYPANETEDVISPPTCRIYVSSFNGELLNVTFQTNNTGSWTPYQSNTTVTSNSTVYWPFSLALTPNTDYWWRVYVDDGHHNVTYTYVFTSSSSYAISFTQVIYPQNEVQVISDDEAGSHTYNYSTYYNTTLNNISVGYDGAFTHGWGYSWYGTEWNLSDFPCNATIKNVTFAFASDYATMPSINNNLYIFLNCTNTTLFQEKTSKELHNDLWFGIYNSSAAPPAANATILTKMWRASFFPYGTLRYFYNQTSSPPNNDTSGGGGIASTYYWGWWIQDFIGPNWNSYGHNISDALSSASRNPLRYPFQMSIVAYAAGTNQTIYTHLSDYKPFFGINYTCNISKINSTSLANFTKVSTGDTYIFNLSCDQHDRIKYRVKMFDVNSSTYYNLTGMKMTDCQAGVIDYNYSLSYTFPEMAPYHKYYFWIQIPGNETMTVFTIYGPSIYIEPPTSIIVHDVNATCLNITFTKFFRDLGTTHTVCYYTEGSVPPSYGIGTLAGNTTLSYINITGLSKYTTYSFSFWTYWALNDSTWSALSNASTKTNTTIYSNIIICLRYENLTADGYNCLVNLNDNSVSYQKNSTHRLIIHYADSTSNITYFNGVSYEANSKTPNQTIYLTKKPLFYEFNYNYSSNISDYSLYNPGTGFMINYTTNTSCTYTRILTPNSEEYYDDTTNLLTFYLITNKYVYLQYYLANGTTTYSDDINNLVEYTYLLDDQSGYYNPIGGLTTYSTIYTYSGSKKIIIDERYVDSAAKIAPTLLYHSYYFVNLTYASTGKTSYLGLLPTDKAVSETLIVAPLSVYSSKNIGNITYKFGWLWDGFYVHYNDDSLGTYRLMFTVWNITNYTKTYVTTFWVNDTSDYNYTYTTDNEWHTYITYLVSVNFTYKFSDGSTQDFTMDSIPIWNFSGFQFVQGSTINAIMTMIFGPSPFYNPDDGTTVPYVDWIVLFIGFALLLTFGFLGQPVLALGSQGLFYIIMQSIINGISGNFLFLGGFLLIMGVLYAIRLGGRE